MQMKTWEDEKWKHFWGKNRCGIWFSESTARKDLPLRSPIPTLSQSKAYSAPSDYAPWWPDTLYMTIWVHQTTYNYGQTLLTTICLRKVKQLSQQWINYAPETLGQNSTIHQPSRNNFDCKKNQKELAQLAAIPANQFGFEEQEDRLSAINAETWMKVKDTLIHVFKGAISWSPQWIQEKNETLLWRQMKRHRLKTQGGHKPKKVSMTTIRRLMRTTCIRRRTHHSLKGSRQPFQTGQSGVPQSQAERPPTPRRPLNFLG